LRIPWTARKTNVSIRINYLPSVADESFNILDTCRNEDNLEKISTGQSKRPKTKRPISVTLAGPSKENHGSTIANETPGG